MENYMVWIWLAVTIIAIIIELSTTQFISLWFAVAGIVAIIFSFIPGLPWWGEVIIFAVVAIALILSLRPICKKFFNRNKNDRTNIDRIVGQNVRMLSQADFDNLGTAKVGDVVWNIKSEDSSPLLADEIVEIVAVDGNKLIAKHLPNSDSETINDPAKNITA